MAETPRRVVASGTISLAATTSQKFLGRNARQDRIQLVVSNLDTANPLKIRTAYGTPIATVFAQTSFTVEWDEDFEVYNPHASLAVDFEVSEFFPNIPYRQQRGQSSGAGGAAGGGAGGGSVGDLGTGDLAGNQTTKAGGRIQPP